MAPIAELEQEQKLITLPFAHAAVVDADLTIKLWAPDRAFRIDRVWYNNITGLAEDANNFFTIKILNDALVAFSWSTETTVGDGSLDADTPVELIKSATDANTIVPLGDVISLFLDEAAGTATLPAGTGIIEGRYVD